MLSTATVTAVPIAPIRRRNSIPQPQPNAVSSATSTAAAAAEIAEDLLAFLRGRPSASSKYTRRRNALVPLPLLPPVPPHVVLKRSVSTQILESQDKDKTAPRTPEPAPEPEVAVAVAQEPAQGATNNDEEETAPPASGAVAFPTSLSPPTSPLEHQMQPPISARPMVIHPQVRARKDSFSVAPLRPTPKFNSSTLTPVPANTPVKPPSNKKRIFHEPLLFPKVPFHKPRISSPLVPLLSQSPAPPCSLPARELLHPNYFSRPRSSKARQSSKSTATNLKSMPMKKLVLFRTLADGQGWKQIALMGVSMAVEVWEAERSLEDFEDELDVDEDMLDSLEIKPFQGTSLGGSSTCEEHKMDVDEDAQWSDLIEI